MVGSAIRPPKRDLPDRIVRERQRDRFSDVIQVIRIGES